MSQFTVGCLYGVLRGASHDPDGSNQQGPIELTHQIGCKVAGFFGNDDTNPTPADVDDYELALRAGGVECEFHRYDGARHAFQNFPSPEHYHEQASEDAWGKLLDFLSRELG